MSWTTAAAPAAGNPTAPRANVARGPHRAKRVAEGRILDRVALCPCDLQRFIRATRRSSVFGCCKLHKQTCLGRRDVPPLPPIQISLPGLLGGPLPRPAAFDLGFEREAE